MLAGPGSLGFALQNKQPSTLTWAIASFSGSDIASKVYLLTGFHKEMDILTGLWLHMTGGFFSWL